MKVIFIGNDKSVFTKTNGDSYWRHIKYAKKFNRLTIIIFSLKTDRLKIIRAGNLTLVPTNSFSRWFYIIDSLKILAGLRDYDLISTQDPFIAGLCGVLAKILFGFGLNIQVHNDFFKTPFFRRENIQNRIFYFLGKLNIKFANSIRVVNVSLKDNPKAFVAPVPVDLNFFWSKPHTKKYNKIVTVSRLAKQKNLPLFFSLARSFPELKFVVIGEGEERNSLKGILPKNVVLEGQKNRDEIKKIFSQSDIFILTSNYEGWGLAVVEALASGLPVIMTNTGCAGEVIRNEYGGKVIPVGDKDAAIKAIDYLLANPKETKKIVLWGQANLRKNYQFSKISDKFIVGLKKTVTLRQQQRNQEENEDRRK